MYALDPGGHVNRCYAALRLNTPLAADVLHSRLTQLPFLDWLSSLTRSYVPGRRASWKARTANGIRFTTINSDSSIATQRELRMLSPERLLPSPTPIALGLIESCGTILLGWHHALLDAHGGELLLRLIGDPSAPLKLIGSTPVSSIRTAKWKSAPTVARQLHEWRNAAVPLGHGVAKPTQAPAARSILAFTKEESTQIWESCRTYGAEYSRGAYLLSAVAITLHELLHTAGQRVDALLAALPMDARRKGVLGPVFGNHLNTLFVGYDAQALTTMRSGVDAAKQQLAQIVLEGRHRTLAEFFELLPFLPTSFASRLLRFPLKHSYASFSVSYTGEALIGEKFLEREVCDFLHFPPNIHPPGFSVIFSEFKKQLRVIVVTPEGRYPSIALEGFNSRLRNRLLGELD